jgi:hypothetical protein
MSPDDHSVEQVLYMNVPTVLFEKFMCVYQNGERSLSGDDIVDIFYTRFLFVLCSLFILFYDTLRRIKNVILGGI